MSCPTAPTKMITIRQMQKQDASGALELMKQLAIFEGYQHNFNVTLDDLYRYGFGSNPRFTCLVAKGPDSSRIDGIAVLYQEPWNYQMAPTFVLKELYVREEHRGQGLGSALFLAVKAHCHSLGAVRLRWMVLSDNLGAQALYRHHGGEALGQWQVWEVSN